MNSRVKERLKALLLVLTAIFLAEKFVSGKLYYYIGPRFGWLTLVAVGLLIALASAYNAVGRRESGTFDHDDHDHDEHTHHHHHDHHGHDHQDAAPDWVLFVVAVPLILGMIIPARPLGATAIGSRGVSTEVALASDAGESRLTVVPSERNILDWVRAMSENPSADAFTGQQADIVGFVYRDIRFSDEQFMVGRFTLTCCVADAVAIGIIVQGEDTAELTTDTWVRVRGTFAEGALDGDPMPILYADEIQVVEAPEQPYLYP